MDLPIFTYSDGRPIEGRPDPLPEGASPAEFIAWTRACNAYRDRAAAVAGRAFDRGLRRALRR